VIRDAGFIPVHLLARLIPAAPYLSCSGYPLPVPLCDICVYQAIHPCVLAVSVFGVADCLNCNV